MKDIRNCKTVDYLETAFMVLFLIYTIVDYNNVLVGNRIIGAFMWISYLLGAGLLLLRLINWRHYVRMPGLFLLIAMCAVCCVSILLNRQYDLKRNIIYLIFWVFYFFMYYAQSDTTSAALAKKRFHILGHIACAGAFVIAGLSLVMMAAHYTEVTQIAGNKVMRGFIDGRLYGGYFTPNGGAAAASIVIMLSVYFIRRHDNLLYRVYAVVNIAVQFFYIVFSDSRSGTLCLAFGGAVYAFFAAVYELRAGTVWKKGLMVLVITLAVLVVGMFMPKQTQQAYNKLVVAVSDMVKEEQPPEGPAADAADRGEGADPTPMPQPSHPQISKEEIVESYVVDRGYDLSGDISNRRFDVWKSGLEIFMARPLYGTSFAGLRPFALEHLPQTYIVNNDYMQMNTLDNDFMNLLASNGIIAFAVFVFFVLWVLVYLFSKAFRADRRDSALPLMMGVCMAAATYSMFGSGVLYLHAPFSVLFWAALGTMTVIAKNGEASKGVQNEH